jgi:hypothetical protein
MRGMKAEKWFLGRRSGSLRAAGAWLSCTMLSGLLVLPAAAQNQPGGHAVKTTAAGPHTFPTQGVSTPAPAPTNLLQQPAKPASVTERNNALSVTADNASLSDILRQVASQTGMKLEGLGGDERVFGSFGPGAPQAVLASLLNGTRYNVLMVGALPNGAPRQLVLIRKTEGGAQPTQPQAQGQPQQNLDEEETGPVDEPEGVLPAPSIEPAVIGQPGAPEPTPPQQAPGRPGQPGQPDGPQVRTPQQLLQQLQQQQDQAPNAADPPQSQPPE